MKFSLPKTGRVTRWLAAGAIAIAVAVAISSISIERTQNVGAMELVWLVRSRQGIINLARSEARLDASEIAPPEAGRLLVQLAALEPRFDAEWRTLEDRIRPGESGASARRVPLDAWADSVIPWATKGGADARVPARPRQHPAYPLIVRLAQAQSADIVGATIGPLIPEGKPITLQLTSFQGLPSAHYVAYALAAGHIESGRPGEAITLLRQTLKLDLLIVDGAIYDGDVALSTTWLQRTLEGLAYAYDAAGNPERAAHINQSLQHAMLLPRRDWPERHEVSAADIQGLMERTPGLPRALGWHALIVASVPLTCRNTERDLRSLRMHLARTSAEVTLFDRLTRAPLPERLRACVKWISRSSLGT